ncbi:MAG: 4-phosphoerythronate dehydrogenase [Paludibacteraceae bacterium]|jgi:erythronate-4-phosphate dehydrogenase|nr:4-phosphoerythronate dehydrogenase [Paludibacteraceae bacterium]
MRVIIDRGIPFLEGVIEPYAQVLYLSPEEITPAVVKDVDAMFVRTRTRINKELLHGSKVRFVATATIGFDHIDQDYCREASIRWVSCPGCNAQAVCDYVEEAISSIKSGERALTIGVVGYGHVGKLVAQMAQRRGYKVLLSDPPLGIGMSLEQLAPLCDILTFHTPLTHEGEHPTYHLCDVNILRLCKPNTLIINAARGGVIDENALTYRLIASSPHRLTASIDCWEGEPNLNRELLKHVALASFHIAGYSVEGKMRASEMCLKAFCKFFSLPILSINKKVVPLHGDSEEGWLVRITEQLKASPEHFEQLRKQYRLR